MLPTEKETIAADNTLLEQARTYIGPDEYLSLLAAVNGCMYTKAKDADGGECALHLTAHEVARD